MAALVLNEEQQMLKDAAKRFMGESAPVSEPPRVSRRLHLLREWSPYEQAPQVFP